MKLQSQPRQFINLKHLKQVMRTRTFAFAIPLYGNETGTKYGQFGGFKAVNADGSCLHRKKNHYAPVNLHASLGRDKAI
jgi:hypothetical protein